MSARRLVLQREVVTHAPHSLNSVPRQVLVLAVRETPQQDPRSARGDVGRQPMVRPRGHGLLIEQVRRHPTLDLVHGPTAQDLRELSEDLARNLGVAVGGARVVVVAGAERLKETRPAHLGHQVRFGRQLVIEAHACHLDARDAAPGNVEGGIRRVPDGGERLVLVIDIPEEVHLVLPDRTAEGSGPLLVRVRNDEVQHGILGVELAVAEIADERSRRLVGARFGDRVHLHA